MNFFYIASKLDIQTAIANLRAFDPSLEIKKENNREKYAVVMTDLNESQVIKVDGVNHAVYLNGICDDL